VSLAAVAATLSADIPLNPGKQMKNREGFSLIEVMIAVLVLSFTVALFGALYPMSMRLRSKSENVTQATMIAQQKIEQIRSIPYDSLTFSSLRSNNLVDASPTSAPYSFTTIDNLANKLPQPTGTVSISNAGTGTHTADLKLVTVTVSWG